MKTNTLSEGEDEQGGSVLPTFDIGSKLSELKQTRKLGTKITMKEIILIISLQFLFKRNRVFATNSDFIIPISLQPNVVDIKYF